MPDQYGNMYLGQTSSVPVQYQSPAQQYIAGNNWNSAMAGLSQQGFTNQMQAPYLGFNNPGQSTLAPEIADYYKGLSAQQGSFANQYMAPIAQGVGALSSLSNMYLGFQNLKLQKQQLGLAREQWQTTKDEMNRIAGVRTKITNQWASN